MTRTWLSFAFAILQTICFVQSTGHYSIVAPGTLRSNFKYTAAISVHKADGPCKFEIGITGPSYNETKHIEVQPMSTENVDFDVPKLKSGDYNLTAKGTEGIKFENSTKLNYADFKPSVFIQTDKATYKPGDKVQFRVVFLDQNTRPATIDGPIVIGISDGAQNRLKQWKDIELTKGVYTGEFQLSDQPVLGNWNIEVKFGDENTETKIFEVAKYVLPKFEVSVEAARDIAKAEGVLKGTVRSKYTYGKGVKGKATIKIEPTYQYYAGNEGDLKAEKTIDIDGKGHFDFDLFEDLHMTKEETYLPPLKVFVTMEEELTGNRQNATTNVYVHNERFRIDGVDTPAQYHPGKVVVFKMVVKNLDDSPVRDSKNKMKLTAEPPRPTFHRGFYMDGQTTTTAKPEGEDVIELESPIDENGMAEFRFILPENKRSFYSLKFKYLESTTHSTISKYEPSVDKNEPLKIMVNTKKPKLGESVSFEIVSQDNLPYFVYTIVARGNIQKMEHVDVPEGRKSHIVKFMPTFEMIPKAVIYAHYVFNNDLNFVETTIEFEKQFENKIDIEVQNQAMPGDLVNMTITTDPESYVGILAVDQSVLLLKSGNDFNKDDIFNSLNNYDTNTPWMRGYGSYPGQQCGAVTLTNANYPYREAPLYYPFLRVGFSMRGPSGPAPEYGVYNIAAPQMMGAAHFAPLPSVRTEIKRPAVKPLPKVAVRKNFLDTWFYHKIENTDEDVYTLSEAIPDTITSWVIKGFSLNPKTGFALTDQPSKIQVFQPFFISTNLPYSIKRGEVFALPVIIFNYMDKALDADVTFDNSDKEFEFTEATNEVEENPINEVRRIKRVTVPPNSGKSISFLIRPRIVGQMTLKLLAVSQLAGDAIFQTLKVEPEGVTHYGNRAFFINLNDKQEHVTNSVDIDIPKEAVLNSEYITIDVIGDLLGPTVKNLGNLVRMPYGCGEQNMVNFVPNILVIKYLKTINQDTPSVVEQATKYLDVGYQRELTYKHDDGSYSAFGKSDKAGSTWLTAYVVRSFHQAKNYTDIDPKTIIDGLEFLASTQADNGSFVENGKLFDSSHQNELGLTSFVLLTFLEVGEFGAKFKPNVEKAMKYILENVDKTDDQYALSIAAAALQKAKNQAGEKVLAKLQTLAKNENGRKWWAKDNETKKDLPFWRPSSNDVEMTSYIVLALLENESAETVLPIIKWLISQRNSNGGFSSTQDTVMGLQALIKFAELTGSGSDNQMDVEFVTKGENGNKGKIHVDKDNALLVQSHVLPKSTRNVNFTAKGTGSCMVQVSYRYNIAEKDKKPSFSIISKVMDHTPPKQLILEICSKYVPLEDADKNEDSNMVVMEVGLPSGYTADTEHLEVIESYDSVKRTETKNSDSTVVVYFDGLQPNSLECIPIEAYKTHAVAKQKPAAITMYDYYDNNRRATEYYKVESSLCDICEGEDCGSGCKKM